MKPRDEQKLLGLLVTLTNEPSPPPLFLEVGCHYVAQAILKLIIFASVCCVLELHVLPCLASCLLKCSLRLKQLTVMLRSSLCCPTADQERPRHRALLQPEAPPQLPKGPCRGHSACPGTSWQGGDMESEEASLQLPPPTGCP